MWQPYKTAETAQNRRYGRRPVSRDRLPEDTVAEIAKAALRLSSANVYRFCDSKKAINQAAAERTMGEIELSRIADGAGAAAERFRKVA